MPTAMPGDGSANAPAGTPQLPNLFAGEAVRPPWMVAGVDYAVGVPAGTTLMDWQNLHGPGISIVGNMVRIDNTSGVHIDGVDFSLHGGAFLLFVNSPGGIVTNSKFQATTPTSLIDTDSNSPGLTVEYCTLIGGADGSGLISAAGNVVIEYNWMKDFPQHAVELGDSTNLTYRYNLIENGGTVAGAHLNYLQETGKGITNSIDIEFNTTYETPSAASGEGFQFDINDTSGNSGTLANPTFAYNTMISTGSGSMSYMVHGSSKYSSSNPIVTPISGTAVAHDNYFDMSGAFGAFYPGSFSGWSLYNNFDMKTGAPALTSPISLTVPSTETYIKMYGVSPSDAELNTLVVFATDHFNYASKIGVADPLIYVYEALGLALATISDTGSVVFKNNWGPSTIASDVTFVSVAYVDVFGHAGSGAQVQQFVDQINFFKGLYTTSGAYGADANVIDLLARGAIYGQMLGVNAELAQSASAVGAAVSLVGVSDVLTSQSHTFG